MSAFLEALKQRVLIADGGMGSMLHHLHPTGFRCTDEVSLHTPDLVQRVHLAFLEAGARLIETNTFGANRIKLQRHGLERQVALINSRSVKLARAAREMASVDAFVGGSIGPTGLRFDPRDVDQHALLLEIFREQASALDERGVDLFVLETFPDPGELAIAVRAVRAVSALPVVAQLTLPAGDDWTDDGTSLDDPTLARLKALSEVDADVLGLNCSLGPSQMLTPLRGLAQFTQGRPLAVQPNSGLPRRVNGRFIFPASGDAWYEQFAIDAVEAGARIVGGCCGTTDQQIRAMAEAIKADAPSRPVVQLRAPAPRATAEAGEPDSHPSELRRKLVAGEFVVSVQVDPPKGTNTGMLLDAADTFRAHPSVHCLDVNSNPMARLHMDALWMSAMLEARGIETIAHYTPRDASIMGIQGNLLGAWNLGVRNVLVITGDPSVVHGEPGAHDVYQTDAIGLVRHIKRLNDGFDCFDHEIGSPPDFTIGVAVNPNADDLDREVERYKAKIDAGAQFAMTQVFFEWSCWERFLARLGGPSPIPVLTAVWPLTSYRLALRLHHEVPGIVIPEAVLKLLENAGPRARAEGFALARDMLSGAREHTQGAYIIAPFKRPVAALELFDDP